MSFFAVRTLAFVISSELTVNIDGSCSSFALLHEGHTGRSDARTSASNSLPQDRHRKSNSGMTCASSVFEVPEAATPPVVSLDGVARLQQPYEKQVASSDEGVKC